MAEAINYNGCCEVYSGCIINKFHSYPQHNICTVIIYIIDAIDFSSSCLNGMFRQIFEFRTVLFAFLAAASQNGDAVFYSYVHFKHIYDDH